MPSLPELLMDIKQIDDIENSKLNPWLKLSWNFKTVQCAKIAFKKNLKYTYDAHNFIFA